MNVEKLKITGFGKLRNSDLVLSPGFNLVYGPNEAGKTTLQIALRALLYGFKHPDMTGTKVEEEREKLRPWSGDPYEAALTYRLDTGEGYDVFRNFDNYIVEVREHESGKDVTDSFEVDKTGEILFAEAHTGVSKRVFTSTAYIAQAQVDRINAPEDLVNKVQKITSRELTGDSTFLALAKLRRLSDEIGGDGGRDKPLAILTGQLQDLKEQRRALEVRRSASQRLYAELSSLYEKRKLLQKRRDQLRYITGKLDILQIDETQEKAAALKAQRDELSSQLEFMAAFEGFPLDAKNRIVKTMATLQVLEKEKRGLEEKLAQLGLQEENHHREIFDLEPFRTLPDDILTRLDNLERRQSAEEGGQREKNRILQDFIDKESELEKTVRQSAPIFSVFPKETDFYFHIEKLEQDMGLVGTLNSLEETIGESAVRLGELQQKARGSLLIATALCVMFVFLVVGGLAINNFIFYPAFLALALAGILFVISNATKKEAKALTVALEGDRKKTEEMRVRINQARMKLSEFLNRASVPTSRELIAHFQHYCVAKKDLETVRNYIKDFNEPREEKAVPVDALDEELRGFLAGKGILRPGQSLSGPIIEDFRKKYSRFQLLLQEADNLKERKGELYKDIIGNQEELSIWESELNDLFTKAGVTSLDDFDLLAEQVEARREIEAQAAEVDLELEQVLRGRTSADLAGAREQAIKETIVLEEENPSFKELDITLYRSQHEEYKLACRELDENLMQNLCEIQRLEGQRITRHDGGISMAELQEKIEQVEMRLRAMQDNADALKAAIESIVEVQDCYLRKILSPELNSLAGEIIRKITANRYEEVEVEGDASGIRMNVKIPETKDLRSAAVLSKGTIDQMYLVLKLALMRLLTRGGERLPLILDDVFATYDHERRRRTFEFLLNLSRDNQIILFTPDRYQRQEILELLKGKRIEYIEQEKGMLQILCCRPV